MKNLDSKILYLLKELKEVYGVQALKAEFEAEGASFDDVLMLGQYARLAGLGLTLKIGGAEAVRDIIDAKKIGVDVIVAPMIESVYALKKFVLAVKSVYSDSVLPKLFINIETITAVNNFDDIVESECFQFVDGVVIGRTDLLGSMNLSSLDSDINLIFDLTSNISKKVQNTGKEFVVGGNIVANSKEFLKDLDYLSNFETRKIVFEVSALNSSCLADGINRALEFEILWLENKFNDPKDLSAIDLKRLSVLKDRYQCCLENV